MKGDKEIVKRMNITCPHCRGLIEFELHPLTPRQAEAFEFVNDYYSVNGFSPTVFELCEALGLSSTGSAHRLLEVLTKKNWLLFLDNHTRSRIPTEAALRAMKGK